MSSVPAFVVAILIGLIAGLTGGLFGVGGGLVAVPGLVLVFRLSQHRAHATSIAAITATATAAAIPFAAEASIDWSVAALLVGGAVVGAAYGTSLMGRFSERTLARVFVVLTVAAGIRLLMLSEVSSTGLLDASGLGSAVVLVITGLAAGVLAALLGVGGGLVFVPALVVVFGLDQHLAQGTSLAAIVPLTLVATVRNVGQDRIDWYLGSLLAAGGITGGLLGAWLALDIAPTSLRRLFVGLLVVVSFRMVRRTRKVQV